MVFKRVCVAAFMDVTFIAFDVPMIRTPRLAVTHQPAVIPVIEGTAVIGSADISGGMRLPCVPLAPALIAYEKIGAAFGAEGALPHLPVFAATHRSTSNSVSNSGVQSPHSSHSAQ